MTDQKLCNWEARPGGIKAIKIPIDSQFRPQLDWATPETAATVVCTHWQLSGELMGFITYYLTTGSSKTTKINADGYVSLLKAIHLV